MFPLLRCQKDTYEKRKKVAHSILVRQGPEVRGGPSPWYLVGLEDGERPASCLEHVKVVDNPTLESSGMLDLW
jgi:hypothetical protein